MAKTKMFKCPHCKQDIDRVVVVSECWQEADLKGSQIIEYDSIDEIGDLLKIECFECNGNITRLIKP